MKFVYHALPRGTPVRLVAWPDAAKGDYTKGSQKPVLAPSAENMHTRHQNEGAWRPKWLIPLLGGRVCGGAEEASGQWIGGRGPVLLPPPSPAWRPFSRNASQGMGHTDR